MRPTFGDLVRNREVEARHQRSVDEDGWFDNMGHNVPAPPGGVFCGQLSLNERVTASVVRNGTSYGGYCGLYEMAFFDPVVGGERSEAYYERDQLGLEGMSLSWMTEDDVTMALQLVALEIGETKYPGWFRVVAIILAVLVAWCIVLELGAWLWQTATSHPSTRF